MRNNKINVQDNKAYKIGRNLYKAFVYLIMSGMVFFWGLGAGMASPIVGIFIWIVGFALVIPPTRKRIYRQITKYINQLIQGVKNRWF